MTIYNLTKGTLAIVETSKSETSVFYDAYYTESISRTEIEQDIINNKAVLMNPSSVIHRAIWQGEKLQIAEILKSIFRSYDYEAYTAKIFSDNKIAIKWYDQYCKGYQAVLATPELVGYIEF